MPDDTTTASPEATPDPSLTSPRRSFWRRHWGKLTLVLLVLVPAAVFALWAAITLGYSYSSGERVGYVQKFSHKGWLCKTWEGELQMSNIPGSAPILFEFSVRSDSIAQVIQQSQGQQVALHYEQHVGVPTRCFGETEYYVSGVRILNPR